MSKIASSDICYLSKIASFDIRYLSKIAEKFKKRPPKVWNFRRSQFFLFRWGYRILTLTPLVTYIPGFMPLRLSPQ